MIYFIYDTVFFTQEENAGNTEKNIFVIICFLEKEPYLNIFQMNYAIKIF